MTVLEMLLAVQGLDSAADQLRHRRAHLPERVALDAMSAERKRLSGRHEELDTERSTLATKLAKIEGDVSMCEAKRADLAKKLSVSVVPREAETLQAEIRSVTARKGTLEDSELEVMELLEPIDASLAEVATEESSLEERMGWQSEILAEADAAVAAELDSATTRRVEAAAAVSGGLLARYEKMRARFGGVAVARLVKGSCSGCNLSLPSIELERLRAEPPDALTEHEECGRLLCR